MQTTRLFLALTLVCFLACKEETVEEKIATFSPEDQAKFDELLEMASVTSMQGEQAVTIKGSVVVGMELVKDSDFPTQFAKEQGADKQRQLMSLSTVNDLSRGDSAYLFFYASSDKAISPITASISVVTPQNQKIFNYNDVVIWSGAATPLEVGFRSSPFFLKLPFSQTFPLGEYRIEVKVRADVKDEILLKKTINLK